MGDELLGNGEKKCPACAEAIKAEAQVCKYCGHAFSEDEVAAAVSEAKSNKRYAAAGCLIFVAILAGLIGWLGSGTSEQPGSSAVEDRPARIESLGYHDCPAEDGGVCKSDQAQLRREWPQALKGDYQAERNVAFSFAPRPDSPFYSDDGPVQSCAWRIVIMKSGDAKVDQTDLDDLNLACGRLNTVDRARARKVAELIRLQQR